MASGHIEGGHMGGRVSGWSGPRVSHFEHEGGYDCSWLRRQALITGSPYWSRYDRCVGYY
jgi:hypothetical protein